MLLLLLLLFLFFVLFRGNNNGVCIIMGAAAPPLMSRIRGVIGLTPAVAAAKSAHDGSGELNLTLDDDAGGDDGNKLMILSLVTSLSLSSLSSSPSSSL